MGRGVIRNIVYVGVDCGIGKMGRGVIRNIVDVGVGCGTGKMGRGVIRNIVDVGVGCGTGKMGRGVIRNIVDVGVVYVEWVLVTDGSKLSVPDLKVIEVASLQWGVSHSW